MNILYYVRNFCKSLGIGFFFVLFFVSFFFGLPFSVKAAADIYSQTDDSTINSYLSPAGSVINSPDLGILANYPSTNGQHIYYHFWFKNSAPNDAAGTYFSLRRTDNYTTCAYYYLQPEDYTLLSDSNWHEFFVESNGNENLNSVCAGHALKVQIFQTTYPTNTSYLKFDTTNQYPFLEVSTTAIEPPPPVDTTNRIISYTLATTSPTNLAFNLHFYINSTSTIKNLSYTASDMFLGQYASFSDPATTTGDVYENWSIPIPPSATSTENFDILSIGATMDRGGASCFFGDTFYQQDPFHCGLLSPADATSTIFFVSTNPAIQSIAELQNLIATSTCSIISIDGCIKNALVWAFYPQLGIDSYASLSDLVKTKAPIGYIYQVRDYLSTLNASDTPATTFEIPDSIETYIFSPFKLVLGSLLWFFYIAHFYRRTKHLQI